MVALSECEPRLHAFVGSAEEAIFAWLSDLIREMHWKLLNIHGMPVLAATNDVITGHSLFGFSTDAIYLTVCFGLRLITA